MAPLNGAGSLMVPIELDSEEHHDNITHAQAKQLTVVQENLAAHINAAMIGAATGDALGGVTEFLSMERIHAQYPHGIHTFDDIRKDFRKKDGAMVAPYTDDTRMAMLVMEEAHKSTSLGLT